MKKLHILFFVLLGLAVTSMGCAKGGHGSLPKIVSVSPAEGLPNDTVSMTLENFNVKKDILLFGGVPVKPTLVEARPLVATRADMRSTNLVPLLKKSSPIIPTLAPLSLTIQVPNLDAGVKDITIRHGDRETEATPFTIKGTLPDGNKGDVATGSPDPTTDAGTSGDEVVTPGAGTTTPPDTTDTGTGTSTPPETDVPPSYPHAVASLSYSRFNFAFNYTRIHWSVSYTEAAFIRVPISYANFYGEVYPDPVSFDQFQGSLSNPLPFSPVAGEEDLLAKFLGTATSGITGNLPYSYCYIPQRGSTYKTNDDCYTANPNLTSYSYVDIAIPLAPGKKYNNGSWKFRLPAHTNVFAVYYRDWENHLNKKEIKVVRPL